MSIQSEINRIAGAKSDIAYAIEDMGGTLSPGASIDDLAAGVRSIPQGSGGTTDANDVTYDSSETYDSGTVGAALNEQRNTLNSKADQDDLTSLNLTGTTNTTGSQIDAGTYFYLNGSLVKAKVDIASGATFTDGTNYETVTVGNELAMLNNSTIISTSIRIQESSSLSYTGLSVTIPANSIYLFEFQIVYANRLPKEIAISGSMNNTQPYVLYYKGETGHASCCGFTPTGLTLYVFGRWDGDNNTTDAVVHGYYRTL